MNSPVIWLLRFDDLIEDKIIRPFSYKPLSLGRVSMHRSPEKEWQVSWFVSGTIILNGTDYSKTT